MIKLLRLELIRQDSPATADELQSLVTQLNAIVIFQRNTQTTVGAAGGAAPLPATPSGYIEFMLGSDHYVLPFYAKA